MENNDQTVFIDNDDIHEITIGINPKTDIRFTVGNSYLKGTPNEVRVTAMK
jgi:hypothetical protein